MSNPINTSSGPASNTRSAEQRLKSQELNLTVPVEKQDQRLKLQPDPQEKPTTPVSPLPALLQWNLVGDALETAIKEAKVNKGSAASKPLPDQDPPEQGGSREQKNLTAPKDQNPGRGSEAENPQTGATANKPNLSQQDKAEKEGKERKSDSEEDHVFQSPNDQGESQGIKKDPPEQGENTKASSVIEEKFEALKFPGGQCNTQSSFASRFGADTSDSCSYRSGGTQQEFNTSKGKEPNWDEDFDMANRDITPGSFSGQKSEDAEDWLHAITFWVQYRNLNEQSAIAAAALLMRDGALQWFNSLD